MADDTTDATTGTDDSSSSEVSDSAIIAYTTTGSDKVEFGNLFEYYYAEEVDRYLWKEIATGNIYSKEAAYAIYNGSASFRYGAVVYPSAEEEDYKVEFPNQFLNPDGDSEAYCETWWIILDVSYDATVDEIKEAYRKLFFRATDGIDDSLYKLSYSCKVWSAFCDYEVHAWYKYAHISEFGWIYHCIWGTKDEAWAYGQKVYKSEKTRGLRFNDEKTLKRYQDWLESIAKFATPDATFKYFATYGTSRIPITVSIDKEIERKYERMLPRMRRWLRKHGYDGAPIR